MKKLIPFCSLLLACVLPGCQVDSDIETTPAAEACAEALDALSACGVELRNADPDACGETEVPSAQCMTDCLQDTSCDATGCALDCYGDGEIVIGR